MSTMMSIITSRYYGTRQDIMANIIVEVKTEVVALGVT